MTADPPAPRRRKRMDWIIYVLALAAVAVVLFLKGSGRLPEDQASSLIREGAPVIDVRTPEEFGRDAVPGAINIPLDQLTNAVTRRWPEKGQPLLLHCQSGGRSMVGARNLRSLGYTNVYNLGSFSRARKLAESAQAR